MPEQIENNDTQEAYWELQKFMVMALKAQGPFESEIHPNDYVISGDTLKFNGYVISAYFKKRTTLTNLRVIEDNGYLHNLRIYRDRDSGGVRLAASVSEGDLAGSPVWTAFGKI